MPKTDLGNPTTKLDYLKSIIRSLREGWWKRAWILFRKMIDLPVQFNKFKFPIIRRIYPNLIANDLVPVQPMTRTRPTAIDFCNYDD